MPLKLAGIKVSADSVSLVTMTTDAAGDFTLVDQSTLKLQAGARPAAYHVLQCQLADYLQQRKIEYACIKGSAVSIGGTSLAHLESAELRGVVQAAAVAAGAEVRIVSKANVSRNFGTRKVDEYLRDDQFWIDASLAGVKKGMREAAFTVLSQFSK
jgi:hypothetical protein